MSHKILRPIIVSMFVIGLVAVQAPQLAYADAIFIVNDTSDAVDANPGDGTCATSTSVCTLRAAVMEANALSGDDIITLPPGTYTLSIPGSLGSNTDVSGNLDVTDNLTINGSGATNTIVDGNGSIVHDSVLQIEPNTSLNISGVTIRGGLRVEGGGIVNLGYLTLTDSVVRNNSATVSYGGGIFNHSLGTVIMIGSTVSNNTAPYGGGIGNLGSLSATNSTIQNNSSASFGGGIVNFDGGELFIFSTGISNNSAMHGGAIFSQFSMATLNDATINNNLASNAGGIFNINGTLNLNNTTVSNNVAEVNGGGLYNINSNSTISNSTLSNNSAYSGGGFASDNDTLILQNTIVSGNIAEGGADCISHHEFSGMLISSGYNLIGNTSDCNFTPSNGDLTNVDPQLGPLQNNGGFSLTHALLPGSPAIDAGNPAGCTDQDGNLLTTDQRGVARPQGAACDIGAFELEVVFIDVSIDIKPDSEINPINTKSKGKIPVAIFSTADFDAPSMVDTTSLTFGRTGDETSLSFCNKKAEDVNNDGLLDLVCHFYTQATGFHFGNTEGSLKGQTLDGISLRGIDNISVVNESVEEFNICPFEPVMVTLTSPDPVKVPVQITTSGQDLNFGATDPPGVNWALTYLDDTIIVNGGIDDGVHFSTYWSSVPGFYYVVFDHPEAGTTYPTIQVNLACDYEAPQP